MSKSIRIRTTPLGEDKHLKVKVDQNFDFLEILSLSISQEEAYTRFCSDYGVVVGRVVANGGFGVPNAKVSIFIPISEEDKNDTLISGIYPYETVFSKNSDNVRYNLLPNIPNSDDPCHVAVGTFPSKREVLDCDVKSKIFEKYYKFTTTTNQSGDFMIFGVPVGEYTIHMDVDISDIGFISQKPYELISQGYNDKLFFSNTQFRKSTNLDNLSQIKTKNSGVSVIPFWGDLDECEIGITRIDFDLDYEIIPTAIFNGNIFGDGEKNSINKACRPRKNMGKLCDMVTSEGTIEIIRKTQDGSIENFSIDGDRLINEDGVWCFQVPMNLDKMVTDEFGNLIPSDDPEKGIATKSKIRFRIGMDEIGDEGRFRSRAKFLVPNRTNNYDFDESTPDEEFAELRWKKIYTVRQFISRYQKNCTSPRCGTKRNFIGIKDVDDCENKSPFPYNRIDTDLNPLFTVICLVTTILMTMIELLNLTIIRLLNLIIGILNSVLCFICKIIYEIVGLIICWIVGLVDSLIPGNQGIPDCRCKFCINPGTCCDCGNIIPYIPCLSIQCDGKYYAPGCYKCNDCSPSPTDCSLFINANCQGWCTAANGFPPDYYPNDGVCLTGLPCANNNGCHSCCGPYVGNDIPYAGAMDCIQVQLAEALNVYKFDFYNDWINGSLYAFLFKYKVRRKKNKKKTFEKFCDYDCVPEFDDGHVEHSKNKCRKRLFLVDTCTTGTNTLGIIDFNSNGITEGVIKEHKDELYYAAMTHNKANLLFATDITCLGSSVQCDIDGNVKLVEQLLPTSYKIPPPTTEFDEDSGDVEVTGIDPLLIQVGCLKVNVSSNNCENIKNICEIGIGLDEDRTDEIPSGLPANCNVNKDSNLEELENEFLRNGLGECSTGIINYESSNITHYNEFRGYDQPTSMGLPSKNSYYFYFGVNPGKTSLDCILNNYFVKCKQESKNLIPTTISTIDNNCIGDNSGSITVNILGGNAPWTYTWTLPDGTVNSPITTSSNIITLSSLISGNYILNITDDSGDSSNYNITIEDPLPLYATVDNVINTSSPTSSDGAISITPGGGVPPYSFLWTPGGYTTEDISNIPTGTYDVTITDSGYLSGCTTQTITLTGVTVSSPSLLSFNTIVSDYNGFNISCFNGNNGQIIINNISGGTSPYTIYVNGNLSTSTTSGLEAGTYTITIYDSGSAQTSSQVVVLTEPNEIVNTFSSDSIDCYGCLTDIISNVSGGVPPYTYQWNDPELQTTNTAYDVASGTYTLTVNDDNGCEKTFDISITQPNKLEILNVNVNNALCYGDSGYTTFIINGGTPPYSYNIYDGNPTTLVTTTNCNPCSSTPCSSCISNPDAIVSSNSGILGPTIQTFTDSSVELSESYYIEVTDANSCKVCTSFTLTSPSPVIGNVTANLISTSPNKYVINSIGSGGVPLYDFELYNNGTCSGLAIETVNNSASASFDNGGAYYLSGTYSIKITDSVGCSICYPITLT